MFLAQTKFKRQAFTHLNFIFIKEKEKVFSGVLETIIFLFVNVKTTHYQLFKDTAKFNHSVNPKNQTSINHEKNNLFRVYNLNLLDKLNTENENGRK